MSTVRNASLQRLLASGQAGLLANGLKGLEKESLRLDREGKIAQTPHPMAFGSALTHPSITTDYSESLIELITPPFEDPADTLGFLGDLHQFVQHHLDAELLLGTSMPIGIQGDESIPIARYGQSNIGQMKHIYRRGLAYRYGRTMQSIAGVHFNYSVNEALWPILKDLSGEPGTLREFIDTRYFGMVRNVYRMSWLLVYLFGSSPALCESFFTGREALTAKFRRFRSDTLYQPHATSLRMSDIGYRNDNQSSLEISLNRLDDYVAHLQEAINTPYPPYQNIGIKRDGQYRQLNANRLQIENEYYSAVRPKQVAFSGEKPTLALKRRGIRYLELRMLDLDCFEPAGISLETLRFLELFILHCLVSESTPFDRSGKEEAERNSLGVACCGRGEDFRLSRNGTRVRLTDWALEILDEMAPIAQILDENQVDTPYADSLAKQRPVILDPGLTPSARVLSDIFEQSGAFSGFALRLSQEHAAHWQRETLSAEKNRLFEESAKSSWEEQRSIEKNDDRSFDQFLADYLAQK